MSGYGNVLRVLFTRVSAWIIRGTSVVESLANLSAISFPTIPLWLGTQSILIVKPAEVRLEYKTGVANTSIAIDQSIAETQLIDHA